MEDGSLRLSDESVPSAIDYGSTTDPSNRETGYDYSRGISGKSNATSPTSDESSFGRVTPPDIKNSASRLGSSTESQELEAQLCSMARQADVSELELQTLRKQIVKETKRTGNLSRRVEKLSKEKDALEKELEKMNNARIVSREGKNPERVIEELRQELYHEKDTNSSLRLQLSKTMESNEELVLAVKDLDEMLRRKDEAGPRWKDEAGPRRDEDGDDDVYGQLEQLALEYEILRQENHEMSCKLEQSRLQEQLKMHYDCFSCAPAMYELENRIETLEKEIEKRSEELREIMNMKIEQEKRAARAEHGLRKMRSRYGDVAAKLQEEFRVLSEQMVLTFEANEVAAAKAMAEASRLRSEKDCMEEMLEKAKEEMSRVRGSYETKLREKADQIEWMKSEIDEKSARVEDQNREIVSMKSEITRLAPENKLVGAVEALENKIERLEEEISSLRFTNDEKDLTIKALKLQLRRFGANRGGTAISARERGMDRERSRKRAAKLEGDVKEINSSPRMAVKKRSNQIAPSDGRKSIKDRPVTTSSAGDAAERVAESSISGARGREVDDALRESEILTEKNRSMELELKGLQERYPEMILKFAEVEGERQQLAMTVQNLAHMRSSRETALITGS